MLRAADISLPMLVIFCWLMLFAMIYYAIDAADTDKRAPPYAISFIMPCLILRQLIRHMLSRD